MKLSDIKPIYESVTAIDQRPEFQRFQQLVGNNVARDVLSAWDGDQRDYKRTGGRGFESLTANLLKSDVLERKYGLRITPEISKAVFQLAQLIMHAMPNADKLRGTTNAPYTYDTKWGHERFTR